MLPQGDTTGPKSRELVFPEGDIADPQMSNEATDGLAGTVGFCHFSGAVRADSRAFPPTSEERPEARYHGAIVYTCRLHCRLHMIVQKSTPPRHHAQYPLLLVLCPSCCGCALALAVSAQTRVVRHYTAVHRRMYQTFFFLLFLKKNIIPVI